MSNDSRAGEEGGRGQNCPQQDKVEEEKDEEPQQEGQNTNNTSDDSVDEQVEDGAGGGTIGLHRDPREDEDVEDAGEGYQADT